MKLEPGQWLVEDQSTKEKVIVHTRFPTVSFRVARDEVASEAYKKLKSKPGTKLHATAHNGNVYFISATKRN